MEKGDLKCKLECVTNVRRKSTAGESVMMKTMVFRLNIDFGNIYDEPDELSTKWL